MRRIQPSTLHRPDDPRLLELVTTFVGERLVCARYAVPTGTTWDNSDGLERVHEVDMGVELVNESGLTLEMSWATPGREEGLAFAVDRFERHPQNELIELVDVSDDREWLGILGRSVEEFAVSFHMHSDDSSIRPWSFRIGASGGAWVTIALGEVGDGALRYMPDNLVVIFDEDAARKYRIPSGDQSAWGGVILVRK